MEAILSQLPYAGVIISIIVLVIGFAAAAYMLDQWRDKKRISKDAADDRLNSILEKTVKELETKVNKLVDREKELTKEVGELRKDNERLVRILQGRDEQTQDFYKQAFEAIKMSKETHLLVESLVKNTVNTNDNIKKLIELLSKSTDVIDHGISKISTN